MKHLLTTISLVATIAIATGIVAFRATGDEQVERALAKQDAMAWLRADFHLTNEQFATIKKLHDSYSVVCEEHCREIMRAIRVRNELKSRPNLEPAALAAVIDSFRLTS